MQIDVLHLFSKDVLPRNLKGHIPEEMLDEAVKVFAILEENGNAKFNVLNLPDVVHDRINIQESKTLKQ